MAVVEPPELPEASAIGVTRGTREIRLRWPRRGGSGPLRVVLPILTWAVAAGGVLAADWAAATESGPGQ